MSAPPYENLAFDLFAILQDFSGQSVLTSNRYTGVNVINNAVVNTETIVGKLTGGEVDCNSLSLGGTDVGKTLASLDKRLSWFESYFVSSTPVLALLDYTYEFQKKDGSAIYAGNIHFQEVTITTDPDKNRLWHFRWGGEIVANKFLTVFQFNPETTLPIGDQVVKITQINFDSAFYENQQEYIQGHITVNNKAINISYFRRVLDFQWDAATATFTLSFNLTNYPSWESVLNWIQVDKNFNPGVFKDYGSSLLSPNGANCIHVELAIRDAVTGNIDYTTNYVA
jgi:hypothetical protein